MEDYDTQDDFEVEMNTATRKRKAPEADKTKESKWKCGKIETLIDELEKRGVFGKDYHNREKREVAYTELEDLLNHSKQYIKAKIVGLRTQIGCEIVLQLSTISSTSNAGWQEQR